MTGIQSIVSQLVHELGLDTYTMAQLGTQWYNLCVDWVVAELALVKLGGHKGGIALEFKPPKCLIEWSNARSKKDAKVIDFTGVGLHMREWWKRCMQGCLNPDDLVMKTWCHAGISGIVMVIMGMKEWGMQLKTKADEERWILTVENIRAVFEKIPSAKEL